MSVCKHCNAIGGYHKRYCPTLHQAVEHKQATETEES